MSHSRHQRLCILLYSSQRQGVETVISKCVSGIWVAHPSGVQYRRRHEEQGLIFYHTDRRLALLKPSPDSHCTVYSDGVVLMPLHVFFCIALSSLHTYIIGRTQVIMQHHSLHLSIHYIVLIRYCSIKHNYCYYYYYYCNTISTSVSLYG